MKVLVPWLQHVGLSAPGAHQLCIAAVYMVDCRSVACAETQLVGMSSQTLPSVLQHYSAADLCQPLASSASAETSSFINFDDIQLSGGDIEESGVQPEAGVHVPVTIVTSKIWFCSTAAVVVLFVHLRIFRLASAVAGCSRHVSFASTSPQSMIETAIALSLPPLKC